MANVLRYPYPDGLLFAEYFEGTDASAGTSATGFVEYSSNPIIDGTLTGIGNNPKEPDCIKIGSAYYMVVTTWSTYDPPTMANRAVELLKSTDLTTWAHVQTIKSAAHAATIFEWGGTFHCLYSYAPSGTNVIGYASASDVESTWTDHGTVLTGDIRDPYVFIESGTVYLFCTDNGGNVKRYSTTATDFTGWGAGTTVVSPPGGVVTNEAPTIVKDGSTYYMVFAEMPTNPTTYLGHNAVIYTASSVTGTWTRDRYATMVGSGATWHDESHGHMTYIRSGDIETNPGPLDVSSTYPIFVEGANGTEWRIGLYYGSIRHTLPAFTKVTTNAIAGIDVPNGRLALEYLVNPADATSFATVPYNLPGGTALWRVEAMVRQGAVNMGASAYGGGVCAYKDASNWWIVRLSAFDDKVWVGRFLAGVFSWLAQPAKTLNFQQDYALTVTKTASNSVSVYVDGVLAASVSDSVFNLSSAAVGLHVYRAYMDMDWIQVWDS